jgi:hypothetical protein
MKVRFALMTALAFAAAPLAAQGAPRNASMMTAVPNVDSLKSQLSLTAEQAPKVAEVVKAFETSTKESRDFLAKAMEGGNMQALRDNPDAMKHSTTLRDARTKLATDLKALLTPAQVTKYDELYPARMRRPQGE